MDDLIVAVKESFYHLNHIIDDYNNIIEKIEEGKLKLKEKEESKEQADKEEICDEGYEYVFDDSNIYNEFDKLSNSIDELSNNIEEMIESKNKLRKMQKKYLLFEFLSLLFNTKSSKSEKKYDYLMPWEEDLVNKGEYEEYHFEEEDMEEDDYYYEDE